jgi:hypothetical protein
MEAPSLNQSFNICFPRPLAGFFLAATFLSAAANAGDRADPTRMCWGIGYAIGLLPNVAERRSPTAAELSEATKFDVACERELGVAVNAVVDNKPLEHIKLATAGERFLVANPDVWPLAVRAGSVTNLASRVGEAEAAASLRAATHNSLDHCGNAQCASNLLEQEYHQALSLVQRRARPLPARLDNESSVSCGFAGDVATGSDTLSFSYVLTSKLIAGYAVGIGCNRFARIAFKGEVRDNIAFIDFGKPGSMTSHALALITDSEVHWQTLDLESAPEDFRAPLQPVIMIDLEK